MDVSIVIPCRNGGRYIGTALDALLAQKTAAAFEIIVADNGSTDDTAGIVGAYVARDPRVRLVDASRAPGANVGRNVGVGVAHARHILLTDADDAVRPGWIESHWRAFESGAEVVGGGLDRILASRELLVRERKPYRTLVGRVPFANATNCGFTVDAFRRVGGFDESLIGTADEVEFFWRLRDSGYQLVWTDAIVEKLMHTNLGDAFRQYFNFGRGEAMLLHRFRPQALAATTGLAAVQSLLWGLLWVTHLSRRRATTTFAWNLGLLSEGMRYLSEPLSRNSLPQALPI